MPEEGGQGIGVWWIVSKTGLHGNQAESCFRLLQLFSSAAKRGQPSRCECHGRQALLSQTDQAGMKGARSLQAQVESSITIPQASGVPPLSVPDGCVLVWQIPPANLLPGVWTCPQPRELLGEEGGNFPCPWAYQSFIPLPTTGKVLTGYKQFSGPPKPFPQV